MKQRRHILPLLFALCLMVGLLAVPIAAADDVEKAFEILHAQFTPKGSNVLVKEDMLQWSDLSEFGGGVTYHLTIFRVEENGGIRLIAQYTLTENFVEANRVISAPGKYRFAVYAKNTTTSATSNTVRSNDFEFTYLEPTKEPLKPDLATVTFNTIGRGTPPEAQLVQVGGLVEQPKMFFSTDGWVVVDWYTDPNYRIRWSFDKDSVTQNLTLYAKWEQGVCVNGAWLTESRPYYLISTGGASEEPGGDTAYYDVKSQTLRLTGFEGKDGIDISGNQCIVYLPIEVTLELVGKSTVYSTGYGIYAEAPLTISGDGGELTGGNYAGNGIALICTKTGNDLIVNGGSFNGSDNWTYGLQTGNDLIINGGEFHLTAKQDALHAGSSNNITLNGGTFVLESTGENGCGIYGGNVTVGCDALTITSNKFGIHPEGSFVPGYGMLMTVEAGGTDAYGDFSAQYATAGAIDAEFRDYSHVKITQTANPILDVQVALGRSLAVNCFTDTGYTDPQMRFTVNGISTVVDGVLEGTRYAFTFEGLAPQWLGDPITVELLLDGVTAATMRQSAFEILEKQKTSSPDNTALQSLIDALLLYGGAAQAYTGHNSDSPVSAGVAAMSFTTLTETDLTRTSKGNVTFTGATVYFDWVNRLKFRFTASDLTGVTFTVAKNGGAEYEVGYTANGDGSYTIVTDAIYADGFDDVYTVRAYRDGAEEAKLTYSVKSYVYTMQNRDTAMGDLARALYNYGLTAQAYRNGN